MRRIVIALLAAAVLAAVGCHEEGPGEKVGRKFDEGVDKLTGDQGSFEKAGEKIDDAIEDTEKKLKQ